MEVPLETYAPVVEEVTLTEDNSGTPIKCKRCKQMFTPLEFHNTKCYYHPGKYNKSIHDEWGWSCCRNDLYASLNIPDFFDSGEALLKISLKDHLHEIAAKFGAKYMDNITAQNMLTGPENEKENEEEGHTFVALEKDKVSDSKELMTTNTNNETALTTLDGVYQRDNRFNTYFNRKVPTQTMSPNEKVQFRDDPTLSPLSHDSIGCTIQDNHVVDEVYMKNITSFPVVDPNAQPFKRTKPLDQELVEKKLGDTRNKLPDFLSIEYNSQQPVSTPSTSDENMSSTPQESIPDKEQDIKEEEDKEVPQYIEHVVEKGDSLISLSLKYKVPIAVLRKVNFLPNGDFIFHRKTLMIPTNGAPVTPIQKTPTHHDIAMSFKTRAGCSLEESRFYLEECEWDVTRALEMYQQDKAWEVDQPQFQGSQEQSKEVKKRRSRLTKLKQVFFNDPVTCW